MRTTLAIATLVAIVMAEASLAHAQSSTAPSDAPVELPASSAAPIAATNASAPPADDASDDRAAAAALGSDSSDVPDPVADEGERTGSAEGEPFPARALLAEEIAALSDRACLRALQRAHVPFERTSHAIGGVATPVRITGPINGVLYRPSERREPHELMDCRRAVALVRFSRMLRRLGIDEVIHYSTYRPADSRAIAEHPLQSRHAGGLAIDAAWFLRNDGQRFSVERDFHSRIGRITCGPEARVPHHDGARLLRTIACDAARLGIFTVILTPHFNYQHRNHFHLEVARGVNWRFVH
jgi:hypothetical protein